MQNRRHQFNPRCFLVVLFLSSLSLCLWLGHVPLTAWRVGFGEVATAQSLNASQLVEQGIVRYQAGNIQAAIEFWQTALSSARKTNSRANEAIILENLAIAYQQIGQVSRAISLWDQVIADYRHLGNRQQVGRMLTEQAQSYSSLGQSRKAIALLCGEEDESQHGCNRESALQIARSSKDRLFEAAALGSLGEAYRLRGEYKQAIGWLQECLKITNEANSPAYRASALNSLGNTYVSLAEVSYRRASSASLRGESSEAANLRQNALSDDATALKQFQESLELAQTQNDLWGQMRALLNSILPNDRSSAATAATVRQQAQSLLEYLPDSQDKVYAAIDLAKRLQPVPNFDETGAETKCLKPELESAAAELLKRAVAVAQRIQDRRSESFALGELGHVYECRQDYQQALELTQQAQWAASSDLLARDSLYLWAWQAGRIFKAQGQEPEALKEYERAVATLETIRDDILNANRGLQFDFRDTVNPLYRELAELRIERAVIPSIEPVKRTQELSSALTTIDALKLAELQNYFGNNCVLTALKPERVDLAGAGTATAVFSSIILKDRTAILVSLPNGEKKSQWINIDRQSLIQEINEFRRGLERFSDIIYDPKQAQQLYDWIVRPFAAELDRAQVKTLVFIQDGILRSVPMAALHDGNQFLIQKYAIATTPSLTLTEPKTLNRQRLIALVLGLTTSAMVDGQSFPALANVGSEIREVETQFPGSQQLLNNSFTSDRLQQALDQSAYPIVHIATHGKFGSEPQDTFLITGNNGKLTIDALDKAIRTSGASSAAPVELLVLTACETAVGDDRAALGLAGVAVQAGVSSVMASLWSIQDAPTVTLVAKFYSTLHSTGGLSKASALRVAQRALIEAGGQSAHPAYWAPFILIGNWL